MKKESIFEEILEAPADMLENLANRAEKIEKKIENKHILKKGSNYLKSVGPGIVTGAADDDPSGIATYSQAGAQFGTSLIWLSIWLLPAMTLIQEMCARIALVTGKGLASNIKRVYSRKVLFFITSILFIANTINIGANLGAMAKAIQMIVPWFNFYFLIIFIGITGLVLQIFLSYKKYVKYLKWFAVSLLTYIVTGLIIKMNWGQIFTDALIPKITFSKEQIFLITAIIGTTISPYLFFWQTSQEVEEEISEGKTRAIDRQGATVGEIKKMRLDVGLGMFFSNLVMFFIIAVCATTLFANGVTDINTATDAAEALRPLAGNGAYFLFALGIIGTGLLSIPVLAGSTSYAITESFGYKEGLYRKLHDAHAFYGIIIISVVIGMLLNFIGVDPIKSLIYAAVLNGIIAPLILICIVHISGSKKIMGKHRNSKNGQYCRLDYCYTYGPRSQRHNSWNVLN
jgi:NRAMP (natural resistance-associated macrophage protein)-like metal ion transporter